MSYTKAIFVVDGQGIKRVDRATPSYDFPTLCLGIESGIPYAKRVEIKLGSSDYSYEKIVCYVLPVASARANFLTICRILGRTPENCVYGVSTCEGLDSLHRTRAGAEAALEAVEASGEVGCYLALEEIEE